MKLSDYIFRFLADRGIKHVFMVPGGGAMHLNDSLGGNPDIDFVCNLHEQASSICAEAYARVTNNPGVALVTTGPGGTNAVTGVLAAWQDSTPCIFLSGQVKRSDIAGNSGVRQLGSQEVDIISIVKSITKYAVTIMEPQSVRYHLEKAYHLARTGRPGPVWIDIPLDVQPAEIDEAGLSGFDPAELPTIPVTDHLPEDVARVLDLLRRSERPVVLAGNGIRLAGAVGEFRRLIDRLGIPVQTTWIGIDLLPHAHPLFAGRPGGMAPRGANFTLQNSDFLLVLGSRLDMATTAYSPERFARCARKVIVDIDPAEIGKLRMKIDLPICADVRDLISEMLRQSEDVGDHSDWVRRCKGWLDRYPVVLPEHRAVEELVSTFHLSEVLSDVLQEGDLIVPTSAGVGVELFFLAFRAKEGQRIFHNRGTGAMGLALPAAIAACIASGGRRTLCLDGDGSFQVNIQELETLRRLALPVKLLVMNNRGYASIRASQKRYFGRLSGADSTSGLSFPDILAVSAAYGVATERISNHRDLSEKIGDILSYPGPVVCEVLSIPDEVRAPAISSSQRTDGSMVSTPMEDLWPFLDREEFLSNMIVPPLVP